MWCTPQGYDVYARTNVAEDIAARSAVMSPIEKVKILATALSTHWLVRHTGAVRPQQRKQSSPRSQERRHPAPTCSCRTVLRATNENEK